ncbi:metalloprotease [Lactarius pseudohatsudake]|nr:metalloprotease [Lactarius pseudohatsudake]
MFASTLSIFLGISVALASVAKVSERSDPSGISRCSTTITDERAAAAEEHFKANYVRSPLAKRASAVINVFFHVISADVTPQGGNLPDSTIFAQMDVLNNNFASTDLKFRLVGIDRTVNADWFNNAAPNSPQQTVMKESLYRGGGAADLNIYSVGFNSTDHLGYATFPFNYNRANPKDDGVVFHYSSVPGGTAWPYNQGKTVTHEVGHWAGLFHTFQGGCEVPGDYVLDTAAEASPAFGCQSGRDTCKEPGIDPIHNYMDYSDDSCVNQFTFGQSQRIRGMLATYRGIQL